MIGRGSVIENSVIGVRARIAENVTIRDTYIMGIDFLEHPQQLAENQRLNRPNLGIGSNSVDRAGDHRQERPNRPQRQDRQQGRGRDSEETSTHVIRDGIVVTHKSVVLPDGSVI